MFRTFNRTREGEGSEVKSRTKLLQAVSGALGAGLF
jgi:hypothetical protein